MVFYHVISDTPKHAGQHILLDDRHPNGVHRSVYARFDDASLICRHPDKYDQAALSHEIRVALRELALEKVRKEKYPQFPSRMASLYVSKTYEEAERWAEYFARIGRPTYGIAGVSASGRAYTGDASKCFDGTASEKENLRLAEIYWENGPNEDGRPPIPEILVDGDIEVLEILKVMNANI